MNLNKNHILYGIIVILVCIILYLSVSEYDHRYHLNGLWVGTKRFCKDSEITSMVLQLRNKDGDMTCDGGLPESGHLVIIDGDKILSNQTIHVSGWSTMKKRSPVFHDDITLLCEKNTVIPESVTFELNDKGLLIIKNETEIYGEFYKSS